LISGEPTSGSDLYEAQIRGPRLKEDENTTAKGGQCHNILENGSNNGDVDDADDDIELAILQDGHAYYCFKIGEG
jgi:hypothetical protein